ncbi:MAG: fumarylacetoacetate hydrolase family protein [Xanthomonadales bacterium]|nr:fumarylacetoacetate hydrolase family protein [Xanthomonadales bacterium]
MRRIFCIGRNYADHVREMGGDPKSDPPVFFCKPADAVVCDGADAPFPTGTGNLHFEGELVVALNRGGSRLSTREEAGALIYGQACGCDLTRRDLQAAAKSTGGPWDAAKGFDASAPMGTLAPLAEVSPAMLDDARLITTVNGEERQNASLSSMIWNVPEIIIALSQLFHLEPGDLVFTGTPEGVGPLQRGDEVQVRIDPLPVLAFRVG